MASGNLDVSSLLQLPNENVVAVMNPGGIERHMQTGTSDSRFAILTDRYLYFHGLTLQFYGGRGSSKCFRYITRNRDNWLIVPVNEIIGFQQGKAHRNTNFGIVLLTAAWLMVGFIFMMGCYAAAPSTGVAMAIDIPIALFFIAGPILLKIIKAFPYISVRYTSEKRELGLNAKYIDKTDINDFCSALTIAKNANAEIMNAQQQAMMAQQAMVQQAVMMQQQMMAQQMMQQGMMGQPGMMPGQMQPGMMQQGMPQQMQPGMMPQGMPQQQMMPGQPGMPVQNVAGQQMMPPQ